MHNKAIQYIKKLLNVYTDNVLLHMVYKLLSRAIIIPKVGDKHFWAGVFVKNNEVIIVYNPSRVNENIEGSNLGDDFGIKQLAFLLAHEACHVLFGDYVNPKTDKDPYLLNIAQDARINPTLIDPDFATVSLDLSPCLGAQKGKGISGVYDVHDRTYSVDEIYELLKKKKDGKDNTSGRSSNNNDNLNGENGSTGSIENNSNDSSENNSNESDNSNQSSDASDNDTLNSDESMCNINNLDSVKIINESSDESDGEIIANIIRKVDNIAKEVSEELHIPVNTVLRAIQKNKPDAKTKSAWEKVIRKYIQGTGAKSSSRYRTYSRPNKRIELLPGYRTLRYRGISVFLDVSGSMDEIMQKAVDSISVISQFNSGISRFVGWDEELKFDHSNVNNRQVHTILKNVNCGCTDLYKGIEYFVKKSPKDDVLVFISDFNTINWTNTKKYMDKLVKRRTVVIGLPDYSNDDVRSLSKVTIIDLN